LTIQDIDPNYTPLVVKSVQWTGTAGSIIDIFVNFSRPVITSTAINPANYALLNIGRDGKYGTLDDSGVQMTEALSPSSSSIVVLTPSQPLPPNQFFHLWISGAVEDLDGNMLSGDGRAQGTSYTAMLARGTKLSYYTPAGDQVSLKTTGGGIIDDLLSGSGEGVRLTVVGEVPHRTVLSGSVRKVRGGTGQAYLGYTIWGLGSYGDVRVRLSSPRFQIDQYPFSPGSAASQAAMPQTVLSGGETKPGSSPAPAVRQTSRKVARTTNRPFHAIHR
jgi:hypothetical protein